MGFVAGTEMAKYKIEMIKSHQKGFSNGLGRDGHLNFFIIAKGHTIDWCGDFRSRRHFPVKIKK